MAAPISQYAFVLTAALLYRAFHAPRTQGYYKAGQLGAALDNVKWVTDYFIKCIGNGQKDIVVQVRV